jgi:Uma2 family endonuclease
MKPAAKGLTVPPVRKPLDLLQGFPLYRLSVQQYQRMEEVGILTGDPKIELIEGFLVEKERLNPPHAGCLSLVFRELQARIPPGWHLRAQMDVALTTSQPQPDAAVVVGTITDYARRHPGPNDSTLVVEVAESSLQDDRTTKLRLYAAARIPTYVIVNLVEGEVELYTRLRAGKNPTYRQREVIAPPNSISVMIGTTLIGPIAVADLLPPS